MRPRAARFLSSVLASVALGAGALFLTHTEHVLGEQRRALGEYDRQTRDLAARIAEIRSGQQAYVAAGQSAGVWIPKVAGLIRGAAGTIDTLRGLAASDDTRKALLDVAETLTELTNIDKRARDYLATSQPLMAGDVVFTEGGDAAATALAQIDSARETHHVAQEADETSRQRLETVAVAGAGGFAALILLALGARQEAPTNASGTRESSASSESATAALTAVRTEAQNAPAPAGPNDAPDPAGVALGAAAELCTEFGRLQDSAGLPHLLAGAAAVMNARGLVVWLGSSAGADLRAVAAHGYSEQVLSLMRPVPRHADNAAAAAYRSGLLQIVAAKPGTSLGAVVAPIVGADGCLGAFAAEIKDNGEVSDTVHALASIVAAQLASVLAPAQAQTPDAKAASA